MAAFLRVRRKTISEFINQSVTLSSVEQVHPVCYRYHKLQYNSQAGLIQPVPEPRSQESEQVPEIVQRAPAS